MVIELIFIGAIAFLIGYVLGKRAGRSHGYQEGTAEAPLMLREQSLTQGRCCLCQSSVVLADRNRLEHGYTSK